LSREILLEIKNISKTVHCPAGSKVSILPKINFEIEKPGAGGQIVSITAASSSELTSFLKIISAIEVPSEGELFLSGKQYHRPAGKIVLIPEHPSSFPWLNVKQNVEFTFGSKEKRTEIINNKIKEAVSFVELESYETHFPDDNSLGFRFRISLARAIASSPEIILLDEPLKNLHGETKKEIFNLIAELPKIFNTTVLIASTNINDALMLSGKIFLMSRHPGRVADSIEIDRSKDLNVHSDYFHSLKHEIEKLLIGYENVFLLK